MTDSALLNKHCQRDTSKLSAQQAEALLSELHTDWETGNDSLIITRTFCFKNYYQTIAFVNALAWVAHDQDHHPDLEVTYNRCVVHFSTHSVGGLSENDFICAIKLDALMPVAD